MLFAEPLFHRPAFTHLHERRPSCPVCRCEDWTNVRQFAVVFGSFIAVFLAAYNPRLLSRSKFAAAVVVTHTQRRMCGWPQVRSCRSSDPRSRVCACFCCVGAQFSVHWTRLLVAFDLLLRRFASDDVPGGTFSRFLFTAFLKSAFVLPKHSLLLEWCFYTHFRQLFGVHVRPFVSWNFVNYISLSCVKLYVG